MSKMKMVDGSIDFEDFLNLKEGDKFYEAEYGMVLSLVVSEGTTVEDVDFGGTIGVKRRASLFAISDDREEPINYLITEGLSHYGPKLYRDAFIFDTSTQETTPL